MTQKTLNAILDTALFTIAGAIALMPIYSLLASFVIGFAVAINLTRFWITQEKS